MNRFALLGRNISHSRSPELYRKLISPSVQYDLLDIASAEQLPTVEELAGKYRGINITTPWKENFFKYAIPEAKQWFAVNCLRFKNGHCEAMNTDATALLELVPKLSNELAVKSWVVLGNGVMAKVAIKVLRDLGLQYTQYSRRMGHDLKQLDLPQLHTENQTKIVINACSRDMNFTGVLDKSWVFWDFNYSHQAHQNSLPQRCLQYIDGFSLLETQARHAVMFWELQD